MIEYDVFVFVNGQNVVGARSKNILPLLIKKKPTQCDGHLEYCHSNQSSKQGACVSLKITTKTHLTHKETHN